MKPYDEMVSGGGAIRPHWQSLMGAVSGLSAGTLSDRGERARRQFRDNGVTYNVYDDPRGSERPWRFDLLPLPMAAAEWESLEAGLAQRARLLQLILVTAVAVFFIGRAVFTRRD